MSNSTPPTPPAEEQADHASFHEGCFAETLAETGWTPKHVPISPALPSAVVPVGLAGHNQRYFAIPNYLRPEMGCMLHDHVRGVYLVVRDVPTPRVAAKLLSKHGISVDATQPPSWGRQQRTS